MLREGISREDCWLYAQAINEHGYGEIYGRGKKHRAHRVMYENFVGEIPEGLVIDHLCMVTWCINPAHLEPVTNEENIRRYVATITHCPNGHEYTPENTRLKKIGKTMVRKCRICVSATNKAYYQRWYYPNKYSKQSRLLNT